MDAQEQKSKTVWLFLGKQEIRLRSLLSVNEQADYRSLTTKEPYYFAFFCMSYASGVAINNDE